MDIGAADAALAAKKAQDSELVQLKTQVDRLRNDLTPGKTKDKKLREACTNFEAVFISKIWEQMRATVPKGGYLESQQTEMYRSMFDRDFAEKLARDGGIGLGDMLYGQLKGKLKDSTKGVSANGAASVLPGQAAAAKPAEEAKATVEVAKVGESRHLKPLPQRSPVVAEPLRPASVAGDVMPDVEALARRIEDAYDRRAQAAGNARTNGANTGSRLAIIG